MRIGGRARASRQPPFRALRALVPPLGRANMQHADIPGTFELGNVPGDISGGLIDATSAPFTTNIRTRSPPESELASE